jgi:hypothetical protein
MSGLQADLFKIHSFAKLSTKGQTHHSSFGWTPLFRGFAEAIGDVTWGRKEYDFEKNPFSCDSLSPVEQEKP